MTDATPVTLPSGCVVALRPLRLSEEALLAKGSGRQTVQRMVEACTVTILEPDPYPTPADPATFWETALMGDQWAALVELRALSYPAGDHYEVAGVRCPACRQASGYDIDLRQDLLWRRLDAAGAEHVRTGAPLTCTIDGREVAFGLPTPATERLRERNEKQHPGRPGNKIRARLRSVAGIEPHEILDWLDGGNPKAAHPGLLMGDVDLLEAALDAHDCGLDSDVELTCPRSECGHGFTITLPFTAAFTRPALVAARARRRAACSAD